MSDAWTTIGSKDKEDHPTATPVHRFDRKSTSAQGSDGESNVKLAKRLAQGPPRIAKTPLRNGYITRPDDTVDLLSTEYDARVTRNTLSAKPAGFNLSFNVEAMQAMEEDADTQFRLQRLAAKKKALQNLTEGQRRVLLEEFRIFAKKGHITRVELGSVLRDLGIYKSAEAEEEGIQSMLKLLGKTRDDSIVEQEFLEMMALSMHSDLSRMDLHAAFNVFDADKSGLVNLKELRSAMSMLGPRFFSEEECSELVAAVDIDKNGTIDIQEFEDYFMSDKRSAMHKKEK